MRLLRMVDKVKSIIKKAVVKMTPFVIGVKVKVKEVVVKMFQNKLVVAVLLVLILSFFIFFFYFWGNPYKRLHELHEG